MTRPHDRGDDIYAEPPGPYPAVPAAAGPQRRACRSCGRPVIYVRSKAAGVPVPLDAEPDDNGNVVLRGGMAVVVEHGLWDQAVETRYTRHAATCPAAKGRRGGRTS